MTIEERLKDQLLCERMEAIQARSGLDLVGLLDQRRGVVHLALCGPDEAVLVVTRGTGDTLEDLDSLQRAWLRWASTSTIEA